MLRVKVCQWYYQIRKYILTVDQSCSLKAVQKKPSFLLGHPVEQTVWVGHFTRIETSNFLVYLENKNLGKLAKIPSFLPL